MNKIPIIILFIFFFLSALYPQSKNNQIAIINLDAIGVTENESITLTDRLCNELVSTGKFTVIERSEMTTILQEQGFQQSGCTSDECAVEMGKLLNINMIIAGSIGKVGALYTISLRVIDVETGEILMTENEDCQCPIETILKSSMKNLALSLAGKSGSITSVSANAGKGDIYIKSSPDDAQIFVDGKKMGINTPNTLRDLPVGEYVIKVKKGDFIGSKVIQVKPNDIIQEMIVLTKAFGGLKIYSIPAEAEIFIPAFFWIVTNFKPVQI